MISYFHIDSIAKMLTAASYNSYSMKNNVTKHVISSSKKYFDITKMARSAKILMSAEIMLMSRDIKLKET